MNNDTLKNHVVATGAAISSEKPNFHLHHRSDIDGLRAVAILPVVAYHAFPSWVPGGFVGVDVFFVISGFLISSILFKSCEAGHFSFLDFYANRIRRIFPALMLVMASCYFLGLFALLPNEYKMLGKHIAAGAAFVTNLILGREAGYFDIDSELKPLMHLWSLAVEEQFYLIFPFIVWISARSGLNILAVTITIFLLSFTHSILGVHHDGVKEFFLPQNRFWELMAGGILASLNHDNVFVRCERASNNWLLKFGIRSSAFTQTLRFRSLLSLFGFGMIFFAVFAFDKTMHYPGWRAFIPVLGAVMLIYAGKAAWINRNILSSRPAISIGLISYPLYLWHWPLLSFTRIMESETPPYAWRIVLVGLSFILATLTYLLVEKPVRYGRNFRSAKAVTLCLLLAMIGCAGFGSYHGYDYFYKKVNETRNAKMPGWVTTNTDTVRDDLVYANDKICTDLYPDFKDAACKLERVGKPNIWLIGDSHAFHFYSGLKEYFDSHNDVNIISLNVTGKGYSPPFLGVAAVENEDLDTLSRSQALVQESIDAASKSGPDSVVILSMYGQAYSNGKIDNGDNLTLFYQGKKMENAAAIEKGLENTLHALQNVKVIYILDTPELDFDVARCNHRPLQIYNKIDCFVSKRYFDKREDMYRKTVLRVLKEFPEVTIFDPAPALLDGENYQATKDGENLYHDRSHLSILGSRYFAQYLAPLINKIRGIKDDSFQH